jgi:hypothetical protein
VSYLLYEQRRTPRISNQQSPYNREDELEPRSLLLQDVSEAQSDLVIDHPRKSHDSTLLEHPKIFVLLISYVMNLQRHRHFRRMAWTYLLCLRVAVAFTFVSSAAC